MSSCRTPLTLLTGSHLSRLAFEPLSAVVSGSDGLDDIRVIIEKAPDFLVDNGLLLIEHGYDQAERIVMMAKKNAALKKSVVILI